MNTIEASAPADPEPDQIISIITVGQDKVGHWLVQESDGTMEGRFITYAAALSFARCEHHACPRSKIVIATVPLTPFISFAPLETWERAGQRAALEAAFALVAARIHPKSGLRPDQHRKS
jgi:hypothetical protein